MDAIDESRFWGKVARAAEADCWPWLAGCFNTGYGAFKWRGQNRGAHRVAWLLCRGDAGNKAVLHRCDNRMCCNPGHLFLGTLAENNRDRHIKGRDARGERGGNTKLTETQVMEIRRLYATGDISQHQLAAAFGVNQSPIWQIIHRKTWTHI